MWIPKYKELMDKASQIAFDLDNGFSVTEVMSKYGFKSRRTINRYLALAGVKPKERKRDNKGRYTA